VPKDIQAILTEILQEHARLRATVKKWVVEFKRGDFSTYVAPHTGRPETVTALEIIDQTQDLILEDRRPNFK
jgi:hypothetical protein